MSDFRNRPNGAYILDANWEALYFLTKHWKSDLLFYRDDLNFLDNLIDKYLIWIFNKHLLHLADLMEDPFKYDSHQFRAEHQQLEDDITNFVKVFRNNRKEVFEVTKMVIESDEFIRQFVVV